MRWSFRAQSSPSLLVGLHTDGVEPWAQGVERVQREGARSSPVLRHSGTPTHMVSLSIFTRGVWKLQGGHLPCPDRSRRRGLESGVFEALCSEGSST